jgi:UPF0755 protein
MPPPRGAAPAGRGAAPVGRAPVAGPAGGTAAPTRSPYSMPDPGAGRTRPPAEQSRPATQGIAYGRRAPAEARPTTPARSSVSVVEPAAPTTSDDTDGRSSTWPSTGARMSWPTTQAAEVTPRRGVQTVAHDDRGTTPTLTGVAALTRAADTGTAQADAPARAAASPARPATKKGRPGTSRAPKGGSSKTGRGRSFVAMTVTLTMVLGVGYMVWNIFFAQAGSPLVHDYAGEGSGTVQIQIKSGDSGQAIGQTLHDAGVVATVDAFVSAYKANDLSGSIQPGTYNLQLKMSATSALAWLLNPTSRVSLRVTVPEGMIATDILQRVASKTTIPLEDLQAAAADTASIGLPAEANGILEGWLFPATYQVEPDMTATELLSQMVNKTVEVLTNAGVPQDQWETVLIKASIIEREAKRDEDRPMMARVIENRLADDYRLQVDTTAAYGAGKSAMDMTLDELRDKNNLYSTYAHTGLPPGPISSPGEASINAVLNPADGDWFYWVTVNLDTGETKFAVTSSEFEVLNNEYKAWKAANYHPADTQSP